MRVGKHLTIKKEEGKRQNSEEAAEQVYFHLTTKYR